MWCDVVTSREMWCLRRKVLQPYKVLLRTTKYYSVLQSTTLYCKVLLRDKWNVQSIALSNLWDAKQKRTTTFMFDSRNTWTVHYIDTMELRHSGLSVATHETSSTLIRATYGMQNAMERRHSCLIVPTHETSSRMPAPSAGVTFQHRQILPLPWKVTLQHCQMPRLPQKGTTRCVTQIARSVIYSGGRLENDLGMIPEWFEAGPRTTRAWTGHLAPASSPRLLFALWRRILIMILKNNEKYINVTKGCAWHEQWRSNITECCACHEKWRSNITKCCACHEKWHSNITKCCACREK